MVVQSLPEYCKNCSWLFSKAGACRPDDVSYIFSFISFIPYTIIILFICLSLIMRGSRQVKITLLLVSSYIIADRILKNIIAMPRPPQACKKTYGFPSSHMVALCSYIFEMLPYCNSNQKFFFVFLIVSQAMARVHLKYHYWDQVIGGIVYALVYTYLFNIMYSKIQKNESFKNLCKLLRIKEDQPRKKQKINKKQ